MPSLLQWNVSEIKPDWKQPFFSCSDMFNLSFASHGCALRHAIASAATQTNFTNKLADFTFPKICYQTCSTISNDTGHFVWYFSTLWKIHAVQGRIPNWQGSALGTFPLLWSSRGKEASCRLHWLSDTWKVTIRTVHNCTCQGCTWTCLIPRLPPPWINEGTVFAGWISNQNTDSDIWTPLN